MIDIPTVDDTENDRRRIAAICDILSNERRVAVIEALAPGEKVSITQVIDDLVGSDDEDARKRVNTALYQTHLPKLATVVEYDWEENEIRRGPQYGVFRDALDAIREDT